MIEKIFISREEVSRFSWLGHTCLQAVCKEAQAPLFKQTVKALVLGGLTDFKEKKVTFDNVLSITLKEPGKTEMVEIVIGLCDWVLYGKVIPRDPEKGTGLFYLKHKDVIEQFFRELKSDLSEGKYQYFYQRINGME